MPLRLATVAPSDANASESGQGMSSLHFRQLFLQKKSFSVS
jgi:hypothetical protein